MAFYKTKRSRYFIADKPKLSVLIVWHDFKAMSKTGYTKHIWGNGTICHSLVTDYLQIMVTITKTPYTPPIW